MLSVSFLLFYHQIFHKSLFLTREKKIIKKTSWVYVFTRFHRGNVFHFILSFSFEFETKTYENIAEHLESDVRIFLFELAAKKKLREIKLLAEIE